MAADAIRLNAFNLSSYFFSTFSGYLLSLVPSFSCALICKVINANNRSNVIYFIFYFSFLKTNISKNTPINVKKQHATVRFRYVLF